MLDSNLSYNYIGIAGNIGAGKTTLTEILSEELNWEASYEKVDDNPFIDDFYDDMKKWAFHLQVYFLNKRYQSMLEILGSNKNVVLDRTIAEDAHIFASNLHDMNLLSSREFRTYIHLFRLIISQLPQPSLTIYLRGSVDMLVKHIQERGRTYEENISINYLRRLNKKYENWIASLPKESVYTIDISEYDFKRNPDHKQKILGDIKSKIENNRIK